MQIKQETEVGQTLWILLIKQTKKIKVGTLYNFHKRGQHSVAKRSIGLEYALI